MIFLVNLCPCGSGSSLADCCDRYIAAGAQPPTAEALMRAQYTSYATRRVEFVERTHAAESRGDFDRAAAEKWAKESEWKGLQILSVKNGGQNDDEGVVRFVALFSQAAKDYRHEEYAHFRKENGAWMFVDGKTPTQDPFVKTGPDVGRNDLCRCGSGKKFKKCHGKNA